MPVTKFILHNEMVFFGKIVRYILMDSCSKFPIKNVGFKKKNKLFSELYKNDPFYVRFFPDL